MKEKSHLPRELRALVKEAVAMLGEVIRAESGVSGFQRIEKLRRRMASLRGKSFEATHRALHATLCELKGLPQRERMSVAHSFGLMLELMNACENAYRTHRLSERPPLAGGKRPDAIIFVLTAHPTEARSPDMIAIFHALQQALRMALERGFERARERVRHLLEVAWRLSSARRSRPTVEAEARHLYSIVLRPDILDALLEASRELAPVYLRSWVGGDKDGHPGVDENVMTRSLQLSRDRLLVFAADKLDETNKVASLLGENKLHSLCADAGRSLKGLARLRAGDAKRVKQVRRRFQVLAHAYRARIGTLHPALTKLLSLLHVFPGMVLPLELRESSDLIMSAACGEPQNIVRMLARLASISRGGDPSWYARGFIVSMASSAEHIHAAAKLVAREFGSLKLPVIPLFEQRTALEAAPGIVAKLVTEPEFKARGFFEVMLGYSDSAKEMGVLPSRLAIAQAMRMLDVICRRAGVRPLFFHGSGGSVDRGGGSVEEQTAWWPASALSLYKATVQGEMVERVFASPEILAGQLEHIVNRYVQAEAPSQGSHAVRQFAAGVQREYQARVADPLFLEVVQRATAYRYLHALKMGSRPAKRGSLTGVDALRAIPWVLCWTQTRVLFPTWWGVGSTWQSLNAGERAGLRRVYTRDPFFRSFVKLLGFTLAKVELAVWRVYLERSGLDKHVVRQMTRDFAEEHRRAIAFVRAISGQRNLLWFRPWLGSSIRLRAPMIHPLNLLQIITMAERDDALLRETVTGIASGMMTTG